MMFKPGFVAIFSGLNALAYYKYRFFLIIIDIDELD